MCIPLSAFRAHVSCTGCVMALVMTLTVMKTQRYANKYLVIQLQSSSVQPVDYQGFQASLM
jgi:3-oxoacyl-[acyl-carrier-protein] synthase III